jgi:co-chaperonin GroES (HSP10)
MESNSNKMFTFGGFIAIQQPQFKKIEADLSTGIARAAQRVALTKAKVVLSYKSNNLELNAGDSVILSGQAGLEQWAKQVLVLDGKEFVLVPESKIFGYEKA